MEPLNTPMIPPGMFPSGMEVPTTDAVAGIVASATEEPVPVIEEQRGDSVVTLPMGWITPEGLLVTTATVRELNGYDEEKLSRFDQSKGIASYITELLLLGVEDLGGEKPTREILRALLVGDRDALILGIRKITYGNLVPFIITCDNCDEKSDINIELDKDIETTYMDDPLQRVFDVELKKGTAKVTMLTGGVQESFGDSVLKKTLPELNTLTLSKCVLELNGVPVRGNAATIRGLSSADRATLVDFIIGNQPGPKLGEIEVPCASCGQKYPISLGLGNLFRA